MSIKLSSVKCEETTDGVYADICYFHAYTKASCKQDLFG
jgi:hypothetical protein